MPHPRSKELADISEELNRRSIELSLRSEAIVRRFQELLEATRIMKEERASEG